MADATQQLEDLKAQTVTVAGRSFRASASTTFRQDLYVMQLVQEAGLDGLAAEFQLESKDISEVAERVIVTAFASGKLFALLGAVMEEEGQPWSMESAKANAEFFATLRTAEDKKALQGALVAVILGFFISGLFASMTSKNSLTIVPNEVNSPVSATNDGRPSGPEATGTSAPGTSLSAS